MLTLGKAVLQAVALWFHLGVEPLIGGGPMHSCHKTQSHRSRAVSLSDGETLTASPRNKRTCMARQKSNCSRSDARLLSQSAKRGAA
jgi:hypothetical protein